VTTCLVGKGRRPAAGFGRSASQLLLLRPPLQPGVPDCPNAATTTANRTQSIAFIPTSTPSANACTGRSRMRCAGATWFATSRTRWTRQGAGRLRCGSGPAAAPGPPCARASRSAVCRLVAGQGLVFTRPDGADPPGLDLRLVRAARPHGWPAEDPPARCAPQLRERGAGCWHPGQGHRERLGHATIQITLDTYSHVLPGLDAQAAETVARLILGDGQPPDTVGYEAPGISSPPCALGSLRTIELQGWSSSSTGARSSRSITARRYAPVMVLPRRRRAGSG